MTENDNGENIFDLPAEMFRSGDKEPDDALILVRRRKEINGEKIFVEDRVIKQFDEIEGNAFFEGDIFINTAKEARNTAELFKRQFKEGQKIEERGIAIVGDQFRWAAGRVKYVIADEFLRNKVSLAVRHWEERTPFRFTEIQADDVTGSTDYISFEDRGGCWSSVGRQGGKQIISLGTGCGVGSAVHEIGHALGLWHEQSRSDRDNFITINLANVSPNARHNFDKHVEDGEDLGDYDFGSIMHYPATAFSIDGQPTILTRDGQPIGQRNGLSPGDMAAIKAIYPNLDWASVGA